MSCLTCGSAVAVDSAPSCQATLPYLPQSPRAHSIRCTLPTTPAKKSINFLPNSQQTAVVGLSWADKQLDAVEPVTAFAAPSAWDVCHCL